jgi:hypothetical protein
VSAQPVTTSEPSTANSAIPVLTDGTLLDGILGAGTMAASSRRVATFVAPPERADARLRPEATLRASRDGRAGPCSLDRIGAASIRLARLVRLRTGDGATGRCARHQTRDTSEPVLFHSKRSRKYPTILVLLSIGLGSPRGYEWK